MIARTIAAVIVVVAAVAALIAAWPQVFGLATAPVVAQVVSVRGLAVAVAIVGAIALTLVALISRPARRLAASLAIILLAFSAISVAVLSTRGFGNGGFESAA